ncbi:MAG TPA: alpha-L-fucosidase [Prolixibacteraceae bacterium]|nr:alpha-L-fucosidase [Prolixibacteraceae bacterium]
MKKLMFLLLFLPLLAAHSCNPPAKQEITPETRMQWWTDAKFGLFIHWGVYAVPAGVYKDVQVKRIGEWIMNRGKIPVAEYRAYAKEFNPVKYDPEAWVDLAKEAGMKYLVITSKHHDGFALFDSKVTDWDMVDATPYGKDLLKPLAKACKKEGIRLGFYYSQAQDWTHPGGAAARKVATEGWANPDSAAIDAYTKEHRGHWDPAQEGSMDEYLDKIAVPQVKEILENYGGLDILWWDTPTDMTKERAEKFLPLIAKYPNLITNNRLGGGYQGDTETPEQYIPSTGFPGRHWEVCMTMNDTWGYKSWDHNWKSTKDLILKLSDIVSKGGNFLLNVGPTAEGEIPQPSIQRLKEVGQWMKVNGEAIYGTQASPFPWLPWGKATLKGEKLYLHVVKWPAGGKLKLPLTNVISNAKLLAAPSVKLNVSHADNYAIIDLPAESPDTILPVICLDIKGAPEVLPPVSDLKTGTASSIDSLASCILNLFDGNPQYFWKAAPGENKAWVEVDLGEEVPVANFSISEPWNLGDRKSQEFELLVKDKDGNWQKVTSGKTRGSGHSVDFETVTGRYFRLNITGPNGESPVINEWILNRAM